MSKKTIVFDFDGVIHTYVSGWQGIDVIPDPASVEVIEAIKTLRSEGYEVIVVSTRCAEEKGLKAVKQYLAANGIEVDGVTAYKSPALVYVDDRAVCFRPGMDLVDAIKTFRPWREK
jgi:histidinol phosphatase-like enzyme